jgi:phosphomethylpyrimidine synthase
MEEMSEVYREKGEQLYLPEDEVDGVGPAQ